MTGNTPTAGSQIQLLATLKQRFRRVYASDVLGLKRLADSYFAEATETVTINQLAFEGGSSAGEITCPKAIALQAAEEVLLELDTTIPRASNSAVAFFR